MFLTILVLGLTSKAERGAVGEATQLWYQLLSTQMDNPIVVQMDHDISRNSALCILPVFESSKLRAGEKVNVFVFWGQIVKAFSGLWQIIKLLEKRQKFSSKWMNEWMKSLLS